MKLSTLYTAIPEYIEFGWVTAPNTAGQNISANTITTLYLSNQITPAITGVSLTAGSPPPATSTSSFTLPAGTYYYEGMTRYTGGGYTIPSVFSLFNETDNAYVSSSGFGSAAGHNTNRSVCMHLNGQIVLTAQKTFSLRLLLGATATVMNGDNNGNFSNSTAGADQRTTIKLWKLK